MFLILLFILFSAGFSYLYSLIPLSNWYLFLWIPLGIISGLLFLVILVLLYFSIASKTKPTKKFKHFILRNACFVAIKFLRIKLEVTGKENIPNETFVVYANHKSNMDPLLIYYPMKRVCSAVGKKSLFKHPVMQLIANTYGAVSIDRENDREAAKSIVTAIKRVKSGLSMIIFPEGGIKSRDTDEMVNLRAGAYKLAVKSEAPILPVSIVNSSYISKKKFFKKIVVKIVFHKPIYKDDYKNLNTTELGHNVEAIINSGIKDAQ